MLRSTFLHLHGVGPATERALWRDGATSWDAFLSLCGEGRLGVRDAASLAEEVEASRRALAAGAIEYFGERLPLAERWRLLTEFADQAAYVDIETTGLSRHDDEITVVGLHWEGRFRAFVRGQDLDEFPKVAERLPLWVTFNGAQFDVPFLKASFPGLAPRAHVDLRFPLRKLGLTGGLKRIEQLLGIVRPDAVRGLSGLEAVFLWNAHVRGEAGALDRLVAYTREDVANLVPLGRVVLDRMPTALGFPGASELWSVV